MVAQQEPCARESSAKSTPNKVAELDGTLRRTCSGGTLFATPGVIALGWAALPQIVDALRGFDPFNADNDPDGEHDFGALEWHGQRLF